MKRSVLILAILYAASVLMPVMHELLHVSDEACQECSVVANYGPSLQADCVEPCSDPTHHHHPQHDHDNCPTCQRGRTLHFLPPAWQGTGTIPDKGAFVPIGSQQVAYAAHVRSSRARAPPFVIVV